MLQTAYTYTIAPQTQPPSLLTNMMIELWPVTCFLLFTSSSLSPAVHIPFYCPGSGQSERWWFPHTVAALSCLQRSEWLGKDRSAAAWGCGRGTIIPSINRSMSFLSHTPPKSSCNMICCSVCVWKINILTKHLFHDISYWS